MTIYIDADYKCFTEAATDRRAVETDVFDGKCRDYIEGYRFVAAGETWTRSDGVQFAGEMITPWIDHQQLDAAQRAYEQEQLEDMRAALELLGVTPDE